MDLSVLFAKEKPWVHFRQYSLQVNASSEVDRKEKQNLLHILFHLALLIQGI